MGLLIFGGLGAWIFDLVKILECRIMILIEVDAGLW
jgi:hypothetical protein